MKRTLCAALLSIMATFTQSTHSMTPVEWFCLLAFPVGGIGGSVCCVIAECFNPCCNQTTRADRSSVPLTELHKQQGLLQAPTSPRSRSLIQTADATQPDTADKHITAIPGLPTLAAAAVVMSQSRRPSLTRPTSPKTTNTQSNFAHDVYVPLPG